MCCYSFSKRKKNKILGNISTSLQSSSRLPLTSKVGMITNPFFGLEEDLSFGTMCFQAVSCRHLVIFLWVTGFPELDEALVPLTVIFSNVLREWIRYSLFAPWTSAFLQPCLIRMKQACLQTNSILTLPDQIFSVYLFIRLQWKKVTIVSNNQLKN